MLGLLFAVLLSLWVLGLCYIPLSPLRSPRLDSLHYSSYYMRMSLRERTRPGLGIIEPCPPSPAKGLAFQVFSLGLFLLFSFAAIDRSSAEISFKKATVTYREIDGHKILADVYRPQDAKICPVIVWIHGGALIMGNRDLEKSDFLLAFAKSKGYAVVSIDYRLAPETKLPDIISDIEEAFRWLAGNGAKQFHLDPRRIVVAGASAGGYLTLVTGYRVRPKPKALVALYGYGDLTGDWSSKPNPYPSYNVRKISREEAESQTDGTIISDSDERKGDGGSIYMYYRQNGLWSEEVSGFPRSTLADKITPFQPIRNVTRDWPPTLLIRGTRDTDVPYEQSKLMAKKFKQKGVPFTFIPIDHGEHGFEGGDAQRIREAYKAMGKFIKKHF
jgi:acetyl esterase/lipase